MTAITLSLIIGSLGLAFDIYFFFIYRKKETRRSRYHKEFDQYYKIMKDLGFDENEIAQRVLEFRSFDELKEHNKKYKKSVSA